MHRALVFLLATACSSLPAPATTQATAAAHGGRTIHVNASATVRQAPDRAVISLGVETTGRTADAVSQANAATMQRVLAAVARVGIPRSDIQTQRIQISPRYDYRDRPEGQEPRIVGYQATNMVVVTVDSVPLVGPVVDAATGAGANQVHGIAFGLRNPEAAHHQALRDAIAKARAEAEVIARALGEPLGPVLQVSTGGGEVPPRPYPAMMEMARSKDEATPVEPGEVEVQARVSLVFRIGS